MTAVTVAQLITLLQAEDPNLPVLVCSDGGGFGEAKGIVVDEFMLFGPAVQIIDIWYPGVKKP